MIDALKVQIKEAAAWKHVLAMELRMSEHLWASRFIESSLAVQEILWLFYHPRAIGRRRRTIGSDRWWAHACFGSAMRRFKTVLLNLSWPSQLRCGQAGWLAGRLGVWLAKKSKARKIENRFHWYVLYDIFESGYFLVSYTQICPIHK